MRSQSQNKAFKNAMSLYKNKTLEHTIIGLFTAFILLLTMFLASYVTADQLVQQFKNPSFSGVGTSSHYLTIDNQEKARRDKIEEDIEAGLRQAERDAENTTLAKFMRNLESRIYSQISKDLVTALFSGEGSTFGTFLIEGNTVTYEKTLCMGDMTGCVEGDEVIVLTIVDSEGSTTTITIPIGAGTIGGLGG
jgi:hypothetical protein